MTPIVPNIFCFAKHNSTLTLKPRVIKDHPTWPLLVTFLAFFSFAFLICGVDGIWNIKWSIQVDILLPFTANNQFPYITQRWVSQLFTFNDMIIFSRSRTWNCYQEDTFQFLNFFVKWTPYSFLSRFATPLLWLFPTLIISRYTFTILAIICKNFHMLPI